MEGELANTPSDAWFLGTLFGAFVVLMVIHVFWFLDVLELHLTVFTFAVITCVYLVLSAMSYFVLNQDGYEG